MELYNKNHTWKPKAKKFVIEMMAELGYDCENSTTKGTLRFFRGSHDIRVGYPNALGVIRIQLEQLGYHHGRADKTQEIHKALGL